MIGPLDSLTTSSSGERVTACPEGAGVADGWEACSAGCDFEHPARRAPADATKAEIPKSLRVRLTGAAPELGTGPQVPHPVVLQPPHALPESEITFNNSPISQLPFRVACYREREAVC